MGKIVKWLCQHREVFGGYETSSIVMLDSVDPADLKRFAQNARSSEDDDWDEASGGYWFDGNMSMVPNVWRGLTQEEVDLWYKAQRLRYAQMGV